MQHFVIFWLGWIWKIQKSWSSPRLHIMYHNFIGCFFFHLSLSPAVPQPPRMWADLLQQTLALSLKWWVHLCYAKSLSVSMDTIINACCKVGKLQIETVIMVKDNNALENSLSVWYEDFYKGPVRFGLSQRLPVQRVYVTSVRQQMHFFCFIWLGIVVFISISCTCNRWCCPPAPHLMKLMAAPLN